MSRYIKVCLTALLLTLAVGILCQPAFAQAQRDVTRLTTQFTQPIESICWNEIIDVTVYQKFHLYIVTNKNGSHLVAHNTYRGYGVGQTSGTEFVGPETETYVQQFDFNTNQEIEFTYIQQFRGITKGPAPNNLTKIHYHTVFNRYTGEVKTEIVKIEEVCRG